MGTQLADATNIRTLDFAYNPAGQITARAESGQGGFGYTGQVWLAEAGLYHYKARAYHAELGVFMQSGPIGHSGGINLYAYVSGDPINFTDP